MKSPSGFYLLVAKSETTVSSFLLPFVVKFEGSRKMLFMVLGGFIGVTQSIIAVS